MSYHQLTQEERYRISGLRSAGYSLREIAQRCGRSPSTISREVRRNATCHDQRYRAERAHSYAVARRRRSRRGSQFSPQVYAQIEAALRRKLSPEQIVGLFRLNAQPVPSHETIYRHIRRDKAKGGTLYRHTRIMSKMGRKRYRSRPARGVLLGKRHISERPHAVESRQRIGDWEADTVMGRGSKHCLLTLVERASGFAIIKKLKARTSDEATRATIEAIRTQKTKFKTITFDNGTEFHGYERLEDLFDVTCYFATPYHSWERGCNENLNGLIRQYLPKGRSLQKITQAQCDTIAYELNSRPRKRLGFSTPIQICSRFKRSVAVVR